MMNWQSLQPLAYLAFHAVIWVSFLLGKLIYRPMRLPDLSGYLKVLPISLAFVVWDMIVTNHWWYFADRYTLFKVGSLPIEEILFFISVPYALLVITENIKQIKFDKFLALRWDIRQRVDVTNKINILLRAVFVLVGIVSVWQGWQYTAVVSLLLSIIWRSKYLNNRIFLVGLCFTLLTTFIFNYYLTALPIVTYNLDFKSPVLILTIPVEDFIYGLILYCLVFERYYFGGQSNLRIKNGL